MLAAMGLAGKNVFITGAARGIGAAVAAESARRGAHVALAGLEPDELAARAGEIGGGTPHFECDVTDMSSVEAAVDGAVAELGGIDIVLANAGIGTYGTVEKGDPEAWLRTIDINLNGVYRTVRATLPHVLESRGYIGVVASVASFAPSAGMSSYNASKAGVESFVRALRQEVGFRGVDAGTIHPGWIDTDLVRDSERDLPSFRAARAKMPWPVRSTTSVDVCARAIADGFERRSARVYVPRGVSVLYWLRSLITSGPGERAMTRDAAESVPAMERDVAALGRSASERTSAINSMKGASATGVPGRR
jgi:NAD(P)-dependent dehydrogenase (short-subunit alcohol dehydrogenase family)